MNRMEGNYCVVLDCPCEQNDKAWIHDELNKLEKINTVIYTKNKSMSQRSRGNILDKAVFVFYLLWQPILSVLKTSQGDTIICWLHWTGLILNEIVVRLRLKRTIVSMNWLTPPQQRKGKLFGLERRAVNNPNCIIVVNSPDSKEKWLRYLECKDNNNIIYHSDVSDEVVDNNVVASKKKNRYCFSGGMNNRDWGLLIDLAKEMPNIKFVCVALRSDWESKVSDDIPSNIEVHFDTNSDQYYQLMRES